MHLRKSVGTGRAIAFDVIPRVGIFLFNKMEPQFLFDSLDHGRVESGLGDQELNVEHVVG